MLYPADPPAVALFFVLLPVIEGIAPFLAGGAEIVGGNSGYGRGIALGIHLEQTAVGPDVCAIGGYEDGNIAYDGDSLIVGIALQGMPLGIKHKLQEGLVVDLILQFFLPEDPVLPVQIPQGFRPFSPGKTVLFVL